MQRVRLTDVFIQNVRPPETGQDMYWDELVPGFGLRVSHGGAKTFIIMFNRNRKSVGRYPALSLSDARTKGRTLLHEPVARAREALETEVTYADAVERYLTIKERELQPKTFEWYARFLRRENFRCLVRDIRPSQVEDAIERIRGQANRSHGYTVFKVFFNWCVMREYADRNPLDRLKKPRAPSSRERVLEDWELTAIWQATEDMGKYGAIVRLLMLTGQRRGQFDRLQEAWVEEEGFNFPGFIMVGDREIWIMKNGKPHYCPMGGLTRFVLMTNVPSRGYYFSPPGKVGRPFTAWSKNKKVLDAKLGIDPWRLHDLRRTWATNCGRLDIPSEIRDRIMSHKVGGNPISRVYDRYKYRKQMAAAMEKMDSFFMELVMSGEPEPTDFEN